MLTLFILSSLQCFAAHCVHLNRQTGDNSVFSRMEARARFDVLECRASCCMDAVGCDGVGADFKVSECAQGTGYRVQGWVLGTKVANK